MSSKWADYLVLRVRYNSSKTHIDQVEVAPDKGDSIGSKITWDREKVVTAIKDETTFVTARLNSSDKYERGEDVRRYRVNNKDYLRTDGNSKDSDNLGKLPEF